MFILLSVLSPIIYFILKKKKTGFVNLLAVILLLFNSVNLLKYIGSGMDVSLEYAIWIGSIYFSAGFTLVSLTLLYIKITRLKTYSIILFNNLFSLAASLFLEYLDAKFKDFDITLFVIDRFLPTYFIIFIIVGLVHLFFSYNKVNNKEKER